MKNKKKRKTLLLVLLLLGISIGFAALSTTLKIIGTTNISKNTWNIYWENKSVNQNGVSTTAPGLSAEQGKTANTIATWSVTLNLPGDFYEFTINAVNSGTIDAMLSEDGITTTVVAGQGSPSTLPEYIVYTVTYEDGTAIAPYHKLGKAVSGVPTKEAYKVRVEFTDDITVEQMNNIPSGGYSYTFTTQATYVQADDNAINRHGLISNCVGCKFAHLEIGSTYDPGSTITGNETDLTNDFTAVKTEYNEQSHAFLGFTTNSNNQINKGYACGVGTIKPFCMEADTDGSKYTSNKQIITEAFGAENCYGNEEETAWYCDDYDIPLDGGQDTGFAHAEVYDDGSMEVQDDFYRCMVGNDGSFYCE